MWSSEMDISMQHLERVWLDILSMYHTLTSLEKRLGFAK